MDELRDQYGEYKQKFADLMRENLRAIGEWDFDTEAEIDLLHSLCKKSGATLVNTEVFAKGGEGAVALANELIKYLENNIKLRKNNIK